MFNIHNRETSTVHTEDSIEFKDFGNIDDKVLSDTSISEQNFPQITPQPPPSSRNEDEHQSDTCLLSSREETQQRSPRSGVSVNNQLKTRLYQYAVSSQVLQQTRNNSIENPLSLGYCRTFKLGRKKQQIKKVRTDGKSNLKSSASTAFNGMNNSSQKPDEPNENIHCHSYLSCKTSSIKSKSSDDFSGNSLAKKKLSNVNVMNFNNDEDTIRKHCENKSVLEVIHLLFERLFWPSDGILAGNIPRDSTDSINLKQKRRVDDGDFVYMITKCDLPRNKRYNPYDLVYITPEKATDYDTYYTISATYITKVSKTCNTHEVTPTLEWLYERKIFYKIYDLKMFKLFKLWKAFNAWKTKLNKEKTKDSRKGIRDVLFTNCLSFQGAILRVKSICYELSYLTPQNKKFLSLLTLDINKTYTLKEFCEKQHKQCSNVKDILKKYRKEILHIVYSACKLFYEDNEKAINGNMNDIEEKEYLQNSGFKQQKQYKSFRIIKEKYNIVEHKPADDPISVKSQRNHIAFKYARLIKIKGVKERIRAFVQLIDFIVFDMLRELVISSVKVLQAQISAASSLNFQPNLFQIFQWACPDSPSQLGIVNKEVIAKPMFVVDLVLNTGILEANESSLNEDHVKVTKSKTCFSSLAPSEPEFESEILSILADFESITSSFPSLLADSVLEKYVTVTKPEPDNTSEIKLANKDYTKLLFGLDEYYQGCLRDIMENIKKGIKEVHCYIKDFDIFCTMIESSSLTEVNVSLEEQDWTTDQFYVVLKKFTGQVSSIEAMPRTARKSMFVVNTAGFQTLCLPYPKRIIHAVNKHLPKIANEKNETLLQIIKRGERRLSTPIEKVEEFVEHLSSLKRVAAEIPEITKEFEIISQLFTIAFKYHAEFTDEERAQYKTLAPSFKKLKALLMYCEAKKDENIHKFSKDLNSIIDNLSSQLYRITILVRNPTLLDSETSSSNAIDTINLLKDDLETLSESAKSFASYENVFINSLSRKHKTKDVEEQSFFMADKSSSKTTSLQEKLIEVEKELMLRKLLWDSIEEWEQAHKKWRTSPFSELDVTYLMKDMSRFVQTVLVLEKGLPSNTLVPKLKKKVMFFKLGMPVISSLRNPTLKKRHWSEINDVTQTVVRGDKLFTLENLIDMNIFQHQEQISEISTRASTEATLEQMLNKVKDYWKSCDLKLLAHGTRDVAIITGIDDILTSLDDSLITLANIRGSRYSLPLQTDINEWDRKLNLFLRTFEEWITVQRNWLYLEPIFSAPDIQRQLPMESKLFQQVDKNWRGIMRRTVDQANALMAATSSGLLDVLQACNSNLEKIHRSLEDYLETKRLVFSRFYFLSNDELIDILANSKQITSVQPYLSKCFANLNKLDFDLTQKPPVSISAMISMENERLILPKSLKARGLVEQWLVNVEHSMYETIKLLIKNSLPQFSHKNFMSWMSTNYGQIVLTVVQIIFCADVNHALSELDCKSALVRVNEVIASKLDALVDYVKKTLPLHERNVAVALIIILVHSRDIVLDLIASEIQSVEDFQWKRQLRYRWDDHLNNCLVDQSIASFTYGYEYLGCSTRLVITPLTNRCFLTLTGALHFHLSGGPSGPAGTGKSESVKDLAKILGKQCIVFNCSEGIDFKLIGRFLSGVSQSGSWCCFDEFNRIDREVLSVIAQQLHVIRTAKLSASIRFMFEGRDICLNSTSGIFITMNPTYAGRVELPDNLKSLFRPVSMVTPDNAHIAEIILFSNGFSKAAILSHKLVKMYELAEKQLLQRPHYDFGLRAIKAVLTMAGERCIKGVGNLNEEQILIQAICDSNFPKLLFEDLKVFQQFLEDVFPNAEKDDYIEHHLLEKSIGVALRELNLQACPSQIKKVIEFDKTLNVRHGVMLVGPTAGGKTTVRKILKRALIIQEGEHRMNIEDVNGQDTAKSFALSVVDMVTINPKSLSLGELYGEFDSNTAEWTDGLLSSTVRRFVTGSSEGAPPINSEGKIPSNVKIQTEEGSLQNKTVSPIRSKHQWLILDGPVDTVWIENLNTMLDDSKLLCLANGERISMLSNMRVIFEVDCLVHASPATISRCGMIYLDPSELGWQPFVKSWLRRQRDIKLPEEGRDYIWKLFENSVESGQEFLSKYRKYCLLNIPLLSIVQTTCNILGAYIKYLAENGGFDSVVDGAVIDVSETDTDNELNTNVVADISMLLFDMGSNRSKKKQTTSLLQQDPSFLTPLLGKLYVFAYTWAFGGHFDCLAEEAEEIDKNAYVPNFQTDGVNIRHLFDAFVRNHFERNFDIQLPTGSNLVHSYYVDLDKGQFVLWDHLLINAKIQLENVFGQSLLDGMSRVNKSSELQTGKHNLTPTPHTICYSFLVALLILNESPVLLSGPVGVGKTVLIQDILQRLSEPNGSKITPKSILGSGLPIYKNLTTKKNNSSLFPNPIQKYGGNFQDELITSQTSFSALTDTEKPKMVLQSRLVKRGRNTLCSKYGEKVLVFVDDLNMPIPDQYASRPALEVLRDFLDYSGFYDSKTLQWKHLNNVTLVSACSISTDTNKRDINQRLLQKFNTICLPRPSAQSLHHIFSTPLLKFLDSTNFSNDIKQIRSDIVSTILGVYQKMTTSFHVTPSTSHYMFNIRDISKIVNGIMQSHPTVIQTKDNFIELLIHELSRVFLDRLINDDDRKLFDNILLDQVHDFLKVKWNYDRLVNNNAIFGDFFDSNLAEDKRVYRCIRDQKNLLKIIESYHDRGKLTARNVPENFYLFPAMCQHVVSAARVLRQPGGHLLLLGIGGTGKTSTTQLACYMEHCEFIAPIFTRTYNLNDFKQDIQKTMIKAGCHGNKIAFFIKDQNVMQESFLEVLCNTLETTDLSVFFDAETKERVALELKREATVQGIPDSIEATFKFFEKRVQQNFHVVFSTSPSGALFHQRCQLYPSLINNCTIDYYTKWQSEALYTVAQKFITFENFPSNKLNSICDVLVKTHEYVDQLCNVFYTQSQRFYHVTPKSFLNFLSLFKTIYKDQKEQLVYKQDRLLSGLKKLDETNVLVVDMKAALIRLGPQLEQKAKDTEELMREILKDQEKVNKVRAVVQREQEMTNRETKKVESVALEAQKDLDNALPQLAAATSALDALNKYDIGEIRSYTNPPTMVMTVLSAVCVILGEKPDWSTAKLLLADPNFLKKLINYDHDNVSDKIHNRLMKYTNQSDFNPTTVGKISVACKSMCSWVLALENYTNVCRIVKPKQVKCRNAQEALLEAKAKLCEKEASLKMVEDQVTQLEQQHEDNLKQLSWLQKSKELTITRLERAALLIKALTNEQDRWSVSLENLKEDSKYILSKAIVLASSTSYCGPFTPSYRALFIQTITRNITQHDIDVIENVNLVEELTDPVRIQEWRNAGLPHDAHSTENALFIQHTVQWPYIIDPQQQALKWIRGQEKENTLRVIKANDPLLIKTLENSIRLGETVVLQNASASLDPILDPIFNKTISSCGEQSIITLCGTEIAYNDNFKLYILTDIENPKLLPELCIKVCVVNFIITMEGLTDQMLSRVVQQKNPELECELELVFRQLVEEKHLLTELEDRSLNLLHNSKGNILDDEDLIQTLDNSKSLAANIKEKLLQTEEKEKMLSEKRQIYTPLAVRGALLYFIAANLSIIDSMYQFSLQWFMKLFVTCITTTEKEKKPEETRRPSSARTRINDAIEYSTSSNLTQRKLVLRYTLSNSEMTNETYIRLMVDLLTETFYKLVSYGIFAKHQLLFSFHLTLNLLLFESKNGVSDLVNERLYKFLLHGKQNGEDIKDLCDLTTVDNLGDQKFPLTSLSSHQIQLCKELELLKPFNGLILHIHKYRKRWENFMECVNPMDSFHFLGTDSHTSHFKPELLSNFERLVLVKTIRPDQFVNGIASFIKQTFGKQLVTPSGFDLKDLYAQSNCHTPIMFILSPGSDPSSQLMKFALDVRGSTLYLDMISLGRSQGPKALEAIKQGYMQKGNWVFLQNCHLGLSFMQELEELVRQLSDSEVNVNPNFRLWLSSKPDVKLPASIIKSSMKVTVEPPPGVKSNLQNSFASVGGVISESLFEDQHIHQTWKQLVYSLCFFHAVAQERKKFGSLGWSLEYDFIAADLEVAVLTLQDILYSTSHIQWPALKFLTGEIIYGGRVTDSWDQRCLLTLLEKFYTPDLVEGHFKYLNDEVYMPPGRNSSFNDCVQMIENLPASDSSQLFGMDENAMYERNREEGVQILNDLVSMQPDTMLNHGSLTIEKEDIIRKIDDILKILPNTIEVITPKIVATTSSRKTQSTSSHSNRSRAPYGKHRIDTEKMETEKRKETNVSATEKTGTEKTGNSVLTKENSSYVLSAVITVLYKEKDRFNNLLSIVKSSLKTSRNATLGVALLTMEIENITQSIIFNRIPEQWMKHSYVSNKSLSSWLSNLCDRVDFIQKWLESLALNDPLTLPQPRTIWLPALFYSQGLLMAILQNHSRRTSCSIDSLNLKVEITNLSWISCDATNDRDLNPNQIAFQGSKPPEIGMYIFGLFLDGASWSFEKCRLEKCKLGRRVCPLPQLHIIPQKKITEVSKKRTSADYICPVYQTSRRRDEKIFKFPNYIMSIPIPTDTAVEQWILSGVAAICQTSD